MRAVDLIRRKRDGHPLTHAEIDWLIQGIANGAVADYQWAALLMAILWRGLNDDETASLTRAMLHSGHVLDLSRIPGPKVDKHSTGGVGDKTSLILAPIAAACGVIVPMVSGRGLGHTGGTLDKLESIPGFDVRLSTDRFHQVLAQCGLALIGQTDEIAPADRTLYSLRDATATVESIPLITASILSKKLAEGLDGLVLDVKTGDGAFMTSEGEARRLAASMTQICTALGTPAVALLTRMDQPLGNAVGNANEVRECIDVLRGGGPPDLVLLSIELAAEMIALAKIEPDLEHARNRAHRVLQDGSALICFRKVIEAQNGDPHVLDDPEHRLPQAPVHLEVSAPRRGFITRLSASAIGLISMRLGAGRSRVDSIIDHRVGVTLRRKLGEEVEGGDALAIILAADAASAERAAAEFLETAVDFAEQPPNVPPLILDRLA